MLVSDQDGPQTFMKAAHKHIGAKNKNKTE